MPSGFIFSGIDIGVSYFQVRPIDIIYRRIDFDFIKKRRITVPKISSGIKNLHHGSESRNTSRVPERRARSSESEYIVSMLS